MISHHDIDELVAKITERARSGKPCELDTERDAPAEPISADDIASAQRRLGFDLSPLHGRLLAEIGDGGFGPGYGLVGIRHSPAGRGQHLVELHAALALDETPVPRGHGIVPLCEWGCGTYSCVYTETQHVLTCDEHGLTDTGITLREWLARWLDGADLFRETHVFEERELQNPFTRELVTRLVPVRPRGAVFWRR